MCGSHDSACYGLKALVAIPGPDLALAWVRPCPRSAFVRVGLQRPCDGVWSVINHCVIYVHPSMCSSSSSDHWEL